MNHTKRNPTAKDISLRITSRWLEHALGRFSEKNLFYSWLLLILLILIFAAFVLNWVTAIKPPPRQPDIAVSVTGPDPNHLEVMIIYIGKDTSIRFLTYNSSNGSGFINKSASPFEYVQDAGETGIIPVSDNDEELEITATLSNARTIKIYSKKAQKYT